jgi:hypothetical protein
LPTWEKEGETMFGFLSDVKDPELYWGARAIFEVGHTEGWGRRTEWVPAFIDLVHDRQTAVGHDHPKMFEFVDWVNSKALPACRKWAEVIDGGSREVFTFEEGEYVLKASPNASYGYMYIGAWKKGGVSSVRKEYGSVSVGVGTDDAHG